MRASIRRLTDGVVARPRWVLGLVAAVTIGFVVSTLLVGIEFESDFKKFLPEDDPSVQRLNRAEATYGSQDLFLVALVTEETIFTPETLEKFKAMEERFSTIIGVDEVRGPATAHVIYGTQESVVVEKAMETVPQTPEEIERYRRRVMGDRTLVGTTLSKDERAGAISVRLDPFEADAPTVVDEIQRIAREYEGPERIYLAGEPVLRTEISQSMVQDLRVLIPFVVLVMVLVLYASFRGARGVILPMAVVLVSTMWAVGTMALVGTQMTPFTVVMPVMLIAIGTADGIHILNKYYEKASVREGDGEASRRAIILRTMEEMATPVVMTSLTTAAGFLGLMTSFLWPQRMFGVFTALGILYAMILSFTLIPALLARLPLPVVRADYAKSPLSVGLARLGRLVSRGPVSALILGVAALAAFSVAIPRLQVETRPDQFLGEDHPVVRAMDVMERYFGGSRQIAIEIDTGRRDGLKDPAVLQKVAALEEYLLSKPEIGEVSSVADVVRQLNETLHASDPQFYRVPDDPRLAAQLFILYGGEPGQLFLGDFSKGEVLARMKNIGSREITRLVADIRGYLATRFGGPGGPQAELVGPTQAYATLDRKIVQSQLASLTASILAAGLIVALLMFSWVAGLLSLIPLVMTLVVEFGVMAYAGVPLDMATLMLGSIAIGIGIDYVIHFMSRFQLEIRRGRSARDAFERTMRTAGKGITYNALALMLGFAVLLASSFKGLVNFGLLIALTMLIASVSSFTIIPALLLLKRPGFLRRPSPILEAELGTEPSSANPEEQPTRRGH